MSGAVLSQMLEVVEHEEQVLAGKSRDQARQRGCIAPIDDAQRLRQRCSHHIGVGHGGERHDVRGGQLEREFQRQPGLADPSGPGQRDQAGAFGAQECGHLAKFALPPPSSAVKRARHLSRTPRAGSQRRERLTKPSDNELEDTLRAREVLERVHAEVAYCEAFGEPFARGLPDSAREQDLTAMTGRHNPRGAVHVEALVAIGRDGGLSRVEPHPDEHRRAGGPRMGR